MGNENSQIEKFTDAALANFDNFKQVEGHEIQSVYGKCSLFQGKIKQDQYILCKKISIGNEERQRHIQQFLEKRMQIQHPNQLKFYGYSLCKQNNFCSTNYSFNAYYEYHRITLLQENNNRQNNEDVYSLNELQYLANSLLSLCEYYQENDEVHPNIHPSTIFLTESGQLKIMDSSILLINSPSQKIHQNQTESITQTKNSDSRYISPEEVVNLKNMDKFKVSIFQVGMTLLESALIQDCSYIYLEDDSINQNSLDFLLNKVQEKYGDSFTAFLKKIVHLNPNNRPDIKEAKQIQLKSAEYRNKNFNNNPQENENRRGDGSPTPRNMRLNSSIIKQGANKNTIYQNGFSFANNNDLASEMSNKNSFAFSQNQRSDKNKYYSDFDHNLIKSPSSFQQRIEQPINSPYSSQMISFQNSPSNKDIKNQDNQLQTPQEQSINNGPFYHNFQSFSNTINNMTNDKNNQLKETQSQSNSNITKLKENTINYYSQYPPSQQINFIDNRNNQNVKLIEQNVQIQNQTPPKSHPLLQGSPSVKQAHQFIEKQNSPGSGSNISFNQVFNNPQSPQTQTLKDSKPFVLQVIEKRISQTPTNLEIIKDQKLVNIQQQKPLNSDVKHLYETTGINKSIQKDPSPVSSTVKVYYTRNNSPHSEPQMKKTNSQESQSSQNIQKSNKIQNILNDSNKEYQNKTGNYYSLSNNTSFQQNPNAQTLITQNNYPLIIQAQKKFMFQTDHKNENSLERSIQEENKEQQQKLTFINSTQIMNPKLKSQTPK